MVFLEVMQWLIAAIIILVFATQIFMPLWKGDRIFPIFRKKLVRVEEELSEVREEVVINTAKRKLKSLKKTAKTLKEESEKDD
jgi:hypothetical protein